MKTKELTRKMCATLDRREFIGGTVACAAVGSLRADERAQGSAVTPKGNEGLRVRFLGTGAADWAGRDARGELRRWTSLLLDGRLLIDFSEGAADMLPAGQKIETIFYTHSHCDHFNPKAALKIGVQRAYVHASWLAEARAAFAEAAAGLGVTTPQVIGLATGDVVRLGELSLTILPANHATSIRHEQTAMYLVEKGATRLLYATDTGGIPAVAARLAGIDAHDPHGAGITALVMEATIGPDHPDDLRLYTHSSVETVAQTVRILKKTGRYHPRTRDQRVYLTHLARTLHGTQAEIARIVPAPLVPAFDGLEVVF